MFLWFRKLNELKCVKETTFTKSNVLAAKRISGFDIFPWQQTSKRRSVRLAVNVKENQANCSQY